MARLQEITSILYSVVVACECEFQRDILAHHPDLNEHPIIQHNPLNTLDAL